MVIILLKLKLINKQWELYKYPFYMAKTVFEMNWNYSGAQYDAFLKENSLVHLKSHGDKYFKVGDALRSSKGVVARIMDKFDNYENCSHDYTIANNKLTEEEMDKQFLGRIWTPIQAEPVTEEDCWDGDASWCE